MFVLRPPNTPLFMEEIASSILKHEGSPLRNVLIAVGLTGPPFELALLKNRIDHVGAALRGGPHVSRE